MRNIERSKERGISDTNRLQSRYTYSFSEYENPAQMGFGALRVVNEHIISPKTSFPLHHHEQMEIITVMLEGTLTHYDMLGNTKSLHAGEVQTITAGTGDSQGEWTNDTGDPARLLQLWMFPKERFQTPRYTQMRFEEGGRWNIFQTIASGKQIAGTLLLHQDAALARVFLLAKKMASYTLADHAHGVFTFLIKGSVAVGQDTLFAGDSMEVTGEEQLVFSANEISDILVVEVPMQ